MRSSRSGASIVATCSTPSRIVCLTEEPTEVLYAPSGPDIERELRAFKDALS